MGPSFDSHLGGLGENQVFIRPIEDVHSIAEIISHLNLWRRETILKIRTGKGSKTDDCEENWLSNEKLQSLGWARLKTDFDESLNEFITLLEGKDDEFLSAGAKINEDLSDCPVIEYLPSCSAVRSSCWVEGSGFSDGRLLMCDSFRP